MIRSALSLPLLAGGLLTASLISACGGGQSATTTSSRAEATYQVGAAKRIVTPSDSQVAGEVEPRLGGLTTLQHFHLGGFGVGPLQNFPDPINQDLTEPAGASHHVNTAGAEEHTWVRVMLIDDPASQQRIAFVSLDAVGAGNLIQDGVRASVATAANLPPENVYFGQTHSHAGADLQGLWGGVPQSWVEDLYANTADAAAAALADLRPAELTLKQLETGEFNNYRRPRVDPNADADNTASLLRAVAADSGTLIASLLQYNAHPTSVGTDNDPRVPHPDYPLGATDRLERDGGVALYFNGPIADASGSGGNCEGDDYVRVRCRGEALAEAVLNAESELISITGPLSVRNVNVILPVTNPIFVAAAALGSFNRYIDYGVVPVSQIPGLGAEARNLPMLMPVANVAVSRISLGDQLNIATIPGEATNTFGEYIQSLAPGAPMMLLGLTQDSMGYILPEEEFNYIDATGGTGLVLPFTNYEEFVSLGPLTAPLLRTQAYNQLFDAPPEADVPPSLLACSSPDDPGCITTDLQQQLAYIQNAYAEQCRAQLGEDNAFCALIGMGEELRPGGVLDLSQTAPIHILGVLNGL